MTMELIIEGQHVDLSPDTDITLEYVSNVLSDIGKISLSRSYTVKLPRSLRNSRILDDLGRPGHESACARRFLAARYYRNGIDLLGDAQAYVLRVTSEAYELALVWNTLPSLQALSQSKKTLNDLSGLPVLTWIGLNGKTPDYFVDALADNTAQFAWYESGLGPISYPEVNAATHPSMNVKRLVDMILKQAGVSYSIDSPGAEEALSRYFVLAAPGHTPSRTMERESGSIAGSVYITAGDPLFTLTGWEHGWDAPSAATGSSNTFSVGDISKHRALINLKTSQILDGAYIEICGVTLSGTVVQDQEVLGKYYFKTYTDGSYVFVDEVIDFTKWPQYTVGLRGYTGNDGCTFTQYNESLPLFVLNRVHESIMIEKDNRFPLEGNLPDIGQWQFLASCMAMYGLVPIIQGNALHMVGYATMFSKGRAVDWTKKVVMNADGSPDEYSPAFDNWAQSNLITFAENTELSKDPTATLQVEDGTLNESREWYKLPFAASRQSSAVHYMVGANNELGDVDIEPRIFRISSGSDQEGNLRNILVFDDTQSGEGLIRAYYSALQSVMQKPVRLSVGIRLNELDLAGLDLTRPVYLGQYGHYFSIIKIQTSDTDLCKVELIQIS